MSVVTRVRRRFVRGQAEPAPKEKGAGAEDEDGTDDDAQDDELHFNDVIVRLIWAVLLNRHLCDVKWGSR